LGFGPLFVFGRKHGGDCDAVHFEFGIHPYDVAGFCSFEKKVTI
jgi:hypothetical protein